MAVRCRQGGWLIAVGSDHLPRNAGAGTAGIYGFPPRNPTGLEQQQFDTLSTEAYTYLKNSDALLPTPIGRLQRHEPARRSSCMRRTGSTCIMSRWKSRFAPSTTTAGWQWTAIGKRRCRGCTRWGGRRNLRRMPPRRLGAERDPSGGDARGRAYRVSSVCGTRRRMLLLPLWRSRRWSS